jgi:hypothetical protein
MQTLITHIAAAVRNGGNDEVLNAVISQYLTDNGLGVTVGQWRLDNYSQLRSWAYPESSELNDALAKINSGSADFEAEGTVQLAEYAALCLAVKTRFQKMRL